MCRFISLTSDMKEIEEWFKDFDRRIESYEKKRVILANDYPILPIVTREGLVKASPVGRNKIHLRAEALRLSKNGGLFLIG